MKVKEESEKVGLKLNIQKTNIMASDPITSWRIDGETMETVTDFNFLGSWISEITCKAPDFAQLYKDAALALGYCINSNQQRYRFTYQDTKDLQIISVLSGNPQILAIAADTIAALRKYVTSSGIDLMGTLIEYINCNYNISLTARNLHIHRQSLLYRLEKIEALTEMSLSNHKDLFLLEICTRILSGY